MCLIILWLLISWSINLFFIFSLRILFPPIVLVPAFPIICSSDVHWSWTSCYTLIFKHEELKSRWEALSVGVEETGSWLWLLLSYILESLEVNDVRALLAGESPRKTLLFSYQASYVWLPALWVPCRERGQSSHSNQCAYPLISDYEMIPRPSALSQWSGVGEDTCHFPSLGGLPHRSGGFLAFPSEICQVSYHLPITFLISKLVLPWSASPHARGWWLLKISLCSLGRGLGGNEIRCGLNPSPLLLFKILNLR